ncbi:unnamed protein product [Candidula unifasciata]|uniref:PiggyBac transposable element-derived protein domain-containing protein n=1 Tax=Candidula unifasciata TaxID=100452 RepID=A0A8S3YPN1_9EUPU|nr:unnamed protein product [Candidula unifasciata]
MGPCCVLPGWAGKIKNLSLVSSCAMSEDETRAGSTKPASVDEYNTRMNILEEYNCLFDKKSRQWWRKISHWLLEITFVNAHRLSALTGPPDRKTQDLTLKVFKLHLI